jgi:hypothetical protein
VKVIIHFKEESNPEVIRQIGAILHDPLESIPKLLIADVDEEQRRLLESHPDVESINDDKPMALHWTDPYPNAFHVESLQEKSYHKRGLTGKGVKVGVIDTGINPHYSLTIAGGYNGYNTSNSALRDTQGHGTACAGIIASKPALLYDFNARASGIAPDVELYSLKSTDDTHNDNIIYTSGIIANLNWAITNKIDIINCSFGGSTDDASQRTAFQSASDAGIILVVSAGNSGTTDTTVDNVQYPAKYASTMANVVCVSAIDSNYQRSSWTGTPTQYSATGSSIMLCGFGNGVYTTWIQDTSGTFSNTFSTFSGTSSACPCVTGIMALYKQKYKNLTATEIIAKVTSSTKDLGSTGRDNIFGYGIPIPNAEIKNMPKILNYKSGLVFDGVGDKISLGTPTQLTLSDNFSIHAKINQSWGNQGHLFSKRSSDGTVDDDYYLYIGDDYIEFGYTYSNAGTPTSEYLDFPTSIADEKDHNVALVVSYPNATLYIDGVQMGSSLTMSGNMVTHASNPVCIGITAGNSAYAFKGVLYNIRVYSRALTQTDVTNLVNETVTRTGLQLEYIFKGSETGTITDTSTNSIVGTIKGCRPSIKLL